jgi:hypothetical protein
MSERVVIKGEMGGKVVKDGILIFARFARLIAESVDGDGGAPYKFFPSVISPQWR